MIKNKCDNGSLSQITSKLADNDQEFSRKMV